ncbi:Pr6Pr family membrane protein [Clavibacter sp. VKM Ac-2873]|uniref:Pr6Pr family membrane protein n=1 Tax=Clavibacter sp. VKM Ac-2873 TaxID=2783813 RepID=UPI00188B199A|nr:Pr6Pr family membrane protein [Clavibacter sp. VKM Ac-2873]
MRITWAVVRLLTALAALVAVTSQYVVSSSYWRSIGVEGIWGKTVDFLMYFTIESNLLAAVVMGAGAVRLLRRAPAPGRGGTTLRLAATTYMVTTGIVYNVLLRGLPTAPGGNLPWANEVLHVAVPLLVLLDWLLAPDRRALGYGAVGRVVVFPLIWVAVTLARGPFTGNEITGAATYYPYPFLDPATGGGGYGTVAIWVAVIAALICGLTLLLTWAGRRASRDRAV